MALSSLCATDIGNYAVTGSAPTALSAPMKLSLHTGDPGTTGASEASGGSYARQTAAYASASGGANALTVTLNFTSMPAGTYTHVGIWDSHGTPKFRLGSALAASKTLSSGDTLSLTAATLTVTGT
jgi:hypothetical protein